MRVTVILASNIFLLSKWNLTSFAFPSIKWLERERAQYVTKSSPSIVHASDLATSRSSSSESGSRLDL